VVKVKGSQRAVISPEEAKLLFALLDATGDDGLLRSSPAAEQWYAGRSRVSLTTVAEVEAMFTLLQGLNQSGAMDHS